jgi:hypothetical protein
MRSHLLTPLLSETSGFTHLKEDGFKAIYFEPRPAQVLVFGSWLVELWMKVSDTQPLPRSIIVRVEVAPRDRPTAVWNP